MLKKEVFLISLILIIVSGCETSSSNAQAGSLNLVFSENMPPEVLRENQAFRVGLVVENYMLQDVNYDLCVSDTPSSRFGGIENQECISSSITAANELGDSITPTVSDQITFPRQGEPYSYTNLDFGVDNTNIIAELTYYLEPISQAEICLAKDVNIKTVDGIDCPLRQKIPGSSISYAGGPIKVSDIEVDISPQSDNKISVFLTLDFQKNSEGIISYMEQGDESIGIHVSVAGVNFNCAGLEGGLVKLTETNKKVSCKGIIDMGENNYYTDTILIKTSYTHTISKTVSGIELKEEDEL